MVTYWESGSAESADYDYGYDRRRRYGHYDEDDEEEVYDDDDDDRGQHLMSEVFDSSLTAEHFSDAEGNPLAYNSIPLDDEEIVSGQPLSEGKPDREDFEGFTGNAGMTLERWYHRAAVVIWPTESRFDVLCESGVEAAVGGLEQMVRRWKRAKSSERADLKPSCLEFAGRIIALWPERNFASRSRPFGSDENDEGLDDEPANGQEFDEEDFDEDVDESDDENNDHHGHAKSSGFQEDDTERKGPPRPLLSLLDDLGDCPLISAWIRSVPSARRVD